MESVIHNIVHRNGKTEDGIEGSWGLPEILALKDAVLAFASAINEQTKKLATKPTGSALDASEIPAEPNEV